MLDWLRQHKDNPYPNDDEKAMLIKQTGLTINQINYWFTNARRRILPKWAQQCKTWGRCYARSRFSERKPDTSSQYGQYFNSCLHQGWCVNEGCYDQALCQERGGRWFASADTCLLPWACTKSYDLVPLESMY